jgi:hypothetical protein
MSCLIELPLLCFISSMRHPLGSKLSHFQVLSQNSEHCRTKNSPMHGFFLHSSVPVFIHALFNYGHSHVCVKDTEHSPWYMLAADNLPHRNACTHFASTQYSRVWSANVLCNSAWHSCAFLPQRTHIFTYKHCSTRWTSTSEQGCQHSDVGVKCVYTPVLHLLVKFMRLVTRFQTWLIHFPHCHILLFFFFFF